MADLLKYDKSISYYNIDLKKPDFSVTYYDHFDRIGIVLDASCKHSSQVLNEVGTYRIPCTSYFITPK